MPNAAWLLVAVVYALAVWLARRARVDFPWRIAALFYALVLIFLFRPMTQAYVNLPVDFVQILPPWSNWLPKTRLSNPEMNDLTMQIVPWAHQVREAWRSLQFPLWNDLAGGGYPLLANGQSSAMSPLRLLALPLPLGYALTAEAAMKLLIALTFMYIFCRRRYAELPSAAGAITFAFCTFTNTWLHFPLVTVGVWLPAALLAVDLLIERRTYARFVFGVVVWAVMLYGGHPETVSHVTFLSALFALWVVFVERRELPVRSLLAIAGAIGVAAILAAPFLATFAEAVTKSRRFHELQADPSRNASVPFSDFPSMIVLLQPHFFGHLPYEKPWVAAAAAESISGFAGVVGISAWVALLLRAIARRRLRDRETFFVLASLVVLGIVLGWPGVSTLFHLVFRLAANARLRLLLCALIAVQTAAIIDITRRERGLWLLIGAGATAGVLLYLTLTVPIGNEVRSDTAVLEMLPSLLALAAATLFAIRPHDLTAVVLATAIVAELWAVDSGWNPVLAADAMYPRTPMIVKLEELQRRAPPGVPFRMAGIGPAMFPNTNAIFGFPDIRTHDPMANGRYLGVLRLTAGVDTADYFAQWRNVSSRMLDYLNVRYVFGARNLTVDDPQRYAMVYDGRDGRVFENRNVLPRFYPARNVILEFKQEDFNRRLLSDLNWSDTALVKTLPVTGDPMRRDLLAPRPASAPEPVVRVAQVSPTDFRLRIHAPRHALIVSSQPWWPGWRVTRNGQAIDPQPVNGAFLGFTVPPGDWEVRVHYFPLTFYLGFAAALITAGVLIAFAMRRQHIPARSTARSE